MKVGLFAINMGPCSEPVTALRVAQAAEAAGFESVWTGEHIVLPDPDPEVPASPVPSGIGHQYGVSLLGDVGVGGRREPEMQPLAKLTVTLDGLHEHGPIVHDQRIGDT